MSLVAALITLGMSLQVGDVAPPGFHPDETLTPPGGPEIAIFRSVAPDVVSLRLSVPLEESSAEAGAGQFLQIQAEDRMRTLAQRIGARAEVHRTPQALVYQVSGTISDLDFLGWILGEGLLPPSVQDFDDTRRQIETELEQRMETPRGVLAARVRRSLTPSRLSVFGNPGSLDRIDRVRLHALWERSHHLANARLVVAGRVPTELILALVADLGLADAPPTTASPPTEETGTPRPDPEILRHWVVQAYRVAAGEEAAALVAGRWLAAITRGFNTNFELGVEIWDIGERARALIVSGAAYPEGLGVMRSRLDDLFTDAAARLTEDDVHRLAGQLETEIVMAARTPWGLAEVVGQAWDAGSGPDGVETLLADLDALTRTQVVGFLEVLDAASPIREELSP